MEVNEKNIDRLIKRLKNFYDYKKADTLATVEFPKDIEYKSEDWLIYIFYSCLLDYGMRSKIYHKNLIDTYEKYPQIFNPSYVVTNFINNGRDLLNIMKISIRPRYPNVAVDKWINLSLELSKYASLSKHIQGLKNFDELYLFIRNIKGYGQKTGGLLLRLIYESNICKFNDDLGNIPLDRHDIEISYLNNVIDSKKINDKEVEKLSLAYVKQAEKLGIKANLLDKYLWELGNNYCSKKRCLECPLKDICKTK